MTERGQVLDRLPDAVLIINSDIADFGRIRSDIDKHQRHFAQAKIVEKRLLHAEGKDRHSVDPALDHSPHRRFHSGAVMHGRGEKDLVIILYGKLFKSLNDLRKK